MLWAEWSRIKVRDGRVHLGRGGRQQRWSKSRCSEAEERTETGLAVHTALQGSTEKWDRGTRMRGSWDSKWCGMDRGQRVGSMGKQEGELGCGSLHEVIYSSPVITGSGCRQHHAPPAPRPRGQEYHALTPCQPQIQHWLLGSGGRERCDSPDPNLPTSLIPGPARHKGKEGQTLSRE